MHEAFLDGQPERSDFGNLGLDCRILCFRNAVGWELDSVVNQNWRPCWGTGGGGIKQNSPLIWHHGQVSDFIQVESVADRGPVRSGGH